MKALETTLRLIQLDFLRASRSKSSRRCGYDPERKSAGCGGSDSFEIQSLLNVREGTVRSDDIYIPKLSKDAWRDDCAGDSAWTLGDC